MAMTISFYWPLHLITHLILISSTWAFPGAPIFNTHAANKAPGSNYIVMFSSNIRPSTAKANIFRVYNMKSSYKGMEVGYVWNQMGFMAKIVPKRAAREMGRMRGVAWMEADTIMEEYQDDGGCVTQENVENYGIDRIDQRSTLSATSLDSSYTYEAKAGEGIVIFVLDTGIDTNHEDFEGRAVPGVSFCESPCTRGGDGRGHGSHVSGIAISKTYGVAKKANAVAVQVLNDEGRGRTSDIISGLQWAIQQNKNAGNPPSVINMSLGGFVSLALNTFIGQAAHNNMVVVVAAGNSQADSCFFSPASAPSAITVGCVDNQDQFCDFSNRGPCVNIEAPGRAITSTWPKALREEGTRTISGTSMSSPHVAGVVARYRAMNPSANPEEVEDWLLGNSVEAAGYTPAFTTDNIVSISCLTA